ACGTLPASGQARKARRAEWVGEEQRSAKTVTPVSDYYCFCIPAALTTCCQRSTSADRYFENSCGALTRTVRPWLEKRWAICGSRDCCARSPWKRLTTAAGVPAGTSMPYQVVYENPGSPASLAVGISGAAAARFSLVT